MTTKNCMQAASFSVSMATGLPTENGSTVEQPATQTAIPRMTRPPRQACPATRVQDTEFVRALSTVINKCSKENGSNTPDYILADFLRKVLVAFDEAHVARARHNSGSFSVHD